MAAGSGAGYETTHAKACLHDLFLELELFLLFVFHFIFVVFVCFSIVFIIAILGKMSWLSWRCTKIQHSVSIDIVSGKHECSMVMGSSVLCLL